MQVVCLIETKHMTMIVNWGILELAKGVLQPNKLQCRLLPCGIYNN